MNARTALMLICLAAPFLTGGCLGRFAANQGRRQAARSTDHYVKKYAEPEMREYLDDNPQTQAEFRQTRNDIADTIVRTGNERQKTRVGVDDHGWLTNEP